MRILDRTKAFISMSFIMVSLVSCNNSATRDYDALKQWSSNLKKEPVPKDAVKLKLIASIPNNPNSGESAFLVTPRYMQLGINRDVFISDSHENAVIRVDSAGKIIQKIGKYGLGPGDFSAPLYIGIDGENRLYIYEGGNQRIQVLEYSGVHLTSFKIFKPCYSMDVDGEGRVYVAVRTDDVRAALINVFNRMGNMLDEFGARLDAATPEAFNNIDICLFREELYVIWRTYPMIRKYSKTGALIFEHYLDFGIMGKLGNDNKNAIETNNLIRFWNVARAIRASTENYYIMRTYPRLEILCVDFNGIIRSVLWDDISYDLIAQDFLVFNEGDKTIIFVLESFPEPRIRVYRASDEALPAKLK